MAIPKIKISSRKQRERSSLSGRIETTTNFGVVFPSFAREMIPNSKFVVKTHSTVFNAPMPVPTFGDIKLINKHVFVPYVDICPQFNSFMAGQPYVAGGTTVSYVPNRLPTFYGDTIGQWLLGQFADFTIYKRYTSYTEGVQADYVPVLLDASTGSAQMEKLREAWKAIFYGVLGSQNTFYGLAVSNSDIASYRGLMPGAPSLLGTNRRLNNLGRLRCGAWFFQRGNDIRWDSNVFDYQINTNGEFLRETSEDGYYITLDNADYISAFGSYSNESEQYLIAMKLTSTGKRLRNILLGLGYQISPNLSTKIDTCNWLKIFAFYKAWFNLFRPKREVPFTMTNCYKLIKNCEKQSSFSDMYTGDTTRRSAVKDLLANFLLDLATQCYYYLPQDYFALASLTPNRNYQDGARTETDLGNAYDQQTIRDYSFSKSPNNYDVNNRIDVVSNTHDYPTLGVSSVTGSVRSDLQGKYSPASIKIAMQLLKYVNKNSVVGRSITDFIKAHFGITLDSSHDTESVYLIGDTSTDIQISEVMSQAGTDTDELGSYAGRGVGYDRKTEEYSFENNSDLSGVWICLSTIIPISGYTQGILRENMALGRFDFFNPELDAVGYDTLQRSELLADYPVATQKFLPIYNTDINMKQAWGFIPRYSHLKVGRNICAGDISLRSYRNQYAGYTLNRMIPTERKHMSLLYDAGGDTVAFTGITAPDYIPKVVHDEFRRIDSTDNLGNFNRIFYSESVNDDHFMLSIKFDVDAYLPAFSLSESFDTLEADKQEVDITHS